MSYNAREIFHMVILRQLNAFLKTGKPERRCLHTAVQRCPCDLSAINTQLHVLLSVIVGRSIVEFFEIF